MFEFHLHVPWGKPPAAVLAEQLNANDVDIVADALRLLGYQVAKAEQVVAAPAFPYVKAVGTVHRAECEKLAREADFLKHPLTEQEFLLEVSDRWGWRCSCLTTAGRP